MRVALLTNNVFPPREGIARHIYEIACRLPGHGIEPLVVARGDQSRGWRRGRFGNVAVSHFPYLGFRPFHQHLMRRTLQSWCDEAIDDVDILHFHLPLLPPLQTDKTQLTTFHSPLLTDTAAITENDLRARLIKWNARNVSRHFEQAHIDGCARLIAVSRGVAEELRQHYRVGERPVELIPNGVDTKFFPYIRGHRRQRRILYVGRLGYRKGLDRLLHGFALVDDPNLRLELAGEGPLLASLRRKATGLGISERVDFLGFADRNQLRERLKTAALFVNPADYESGPLTLLEAMATGTPVVTTPTGIAAELGPNPPLSICNASPEALAASIDHILARPEEARAKALAARRLVEERYDWSRVTAALADHYRAPERLAA